METKRNIIHGLVYTLLDHIVKHNDNIPTNSSSILYRYFQLQYNVMSLLNADKPYLCELRYPSWYLDLKKKCARSKDKLDILSQLLVYAHSGFVTELYGETQTPTFQELGIVNTMMNHVFVAPVEEWGIEHAKLVRKVKKSNDSKEMEIYVDVNGIEIEEKPTKWITHISPSGDYRNEDGIPIIDVNSSFTYNRHAFDSENWSDTDEYKPIFPQLCSELHYDSEKDVSKLPDFIKEYENLTDKNKVLAEFFSFSGSTVQSVNVFWLILAVQLSQKYNQSLELNIKLYFQLSSALYYGSLATWELKKKFQAPSLVQLIRWHLKEDKLRSWTPLKTEEIQGKLWMPYRKPEYINPRYPTSYSYRIIASILANRVLDDWFNNDSYYSPFSLVHLPNPSHISPMLSQEVKLVGCGEFVICPGTSGIEKGTNPEESYTLRFNQLEDLVNVISISGYYGGIYTKQTIELSKTIAETIYNKHKENIIFN